jgi:hypothetical protein
MRNCDNRSSGGGTSTRKGLDMLECAQLTVWNKCAVLQTNTDLFQSCLRLFHVDARACESCDMQE